MKIKTVSLLVLFSCGNLIDVYGMDRLIAQFTARCNVREDENKGKNTINPSNKKESVIIKKEKNIIFWIKEVPREVWGMILNYLNNNEFRSFMSASKQCKEIAIEFFPYFKNYFVNFKKLRNVPTDDLECLLVLHRLVNECEDGNWLTDYLKRFKFSNDMVNFRDHKRKTPLFHAILKNKNNFAMALIDRGADISVTDEDGVPLLAIAIRAKNKEMFTYLLKAKPIPQGWCFFNEAATQCDSDDDLYFFEKLFEVDKNHLLLKSSQQNNALMRAVEYKKYKGALWVVAKLFDPALYTEEQIKAMLNTQSISEKKTSLHFLCDAKELSPELRNDRKIIIRKLLELGADSSLKDSNNKIPLDYFEKKSTEPEDLETLLILYNVKPIPRKK